MVAELQNISKFYGRPGSDTGSLILDQVSLAIEENGSLAVVGPSGSGKSTLLNILGTLDCPSSGKVFLQGRDVSGLDEAELAGLRNQFIGFVFQQHHLLPQLTLAENVLLPVMPVKDKARREEATERAYELIDRLGLKKPHPPPARPAVGGRMPTGCRGEGPGEPAGAFAGR